MTGVHATAFLPGGGRSEYASLRLRNDNLSVIENQSPGQSDLNLMSPQSYDLLLAKTMSSSAGSARNPADFGQDLD